MNPLYAILSGFEVGNTPGVGTFYDFIKRMWNSDDNHLSPHVHPLKSKVKKPKTKGTKADSVEKVTVAELLPQLENTDFLLEEQPYASLFKIYKKEFLDVSVSKGLIHNKSLALAGDGTPVVTSHRERKKRICDCKEKGITDCKCDRYFSQPHGQHRHRRDASRSGFRKGLRTVQEHHSLHNLCHHYKGSRDNQIPCFRSLLS